MIFSLLILLLTFIILPVIKCFLSLMSKLILFMMPIFYLFQITYSIESGYKSIKDRIGDFEITIPINKTIWIIIFPWISSIHSFRPDSLVDSQLIYDPLANCISFEFCYSSTNFFHTLQTISQSYSHMSPYHLQATVQSCSALLISTILQPLMTPFHQILV